MDWGRTRRVVLFFFFSLFFSHSRGKILRSYNKLPILVITNVQRETCLGVYCTSVMYINTTEEIIRKQSRSIVSAASCFGNV